MHEHEHHHEHGHDHCRPHHKKCRHACGHHTIGGGIWFIGWLFTIGYLHLSFWSGVLALVIWPYYLGMSLAG